MNIYINPVDIGNGFIRSENWSVDQNGHKTFICHSLKLKDNL